MGCVAYDVVDVIKSVWMSEHALHFVIRRGVYWGLQRASPYGFGLLGGFFLFYLSAPSRTVMMIIPLPVMVIILPQQISVGKNVSHFLLTKLNLYIQFNYFNFCWSICQHKDDVFSLKRPVTLSKHSYHRLKHVMCVCGGGGGGLCVYVPVYLSVCVRTGLEGAAGESCLRGGACWSTYYMLPFLCHLKVLCHLIDSYQLNR